MSRTPIAAAVALALAAGTAVGGAAGVHQAKGLTFRCVATTRGGATTAFVVHQKDDKGNVTYAAP